MQEVSGDSTSFYRRAQGLDVAEFLSGARILANQNRSLLAVTIALIRYIFMHFEKNLDELDELANQRIRTITAGDYQHVLRIAGPGNEHFMQIEESSLTHVKLTKNCIENLYRETGMEIVRTDLNTIDAFLQNARPRIDWLGRPFLVNETSPNDYKCLRDVADDVKKISEIFLRFPPTFRERKIGLEIVDKLVELSAASDRQRENAGILPKIFSFIYKDILGMQNTHNSLRSDFSDLTRWNFRWISLQKFEEHFPSESGDQVRGLNNGLGVLLDNEKIHAKAAEETT